MSKKKFNPVVLGILAVLFFGLLIPQPIEALLVLVDWSVSRALNENLVILCIVVGLIQGLCEEGGYYLVLRHFSKENIDWKFAYLFALGRSGLEFVYNLIMLIGQSNSAGMFCVAVFVKLLMAAGLIGLTMFDYIAARFHRLKFLWLFAVFLHMVMNGVLYAFDEEVIHVTQIGQNLFCVVYSTIVIICAGLMVRYVRGRSLKQISRRQPRNKGHSK